MGRRKLQSGPTSSTGPTRQTELPSPWWLRHGGWLAALLAIALYLPSLRFGYIIDDKEIVRDDYRIREWSHPAAYLLTSWWNRTDLAALEYRPAALASFALDVRLWGTSPAGSHAVNVLIYGLCAGLLWLLIRRLSNDLRLALVAALLFAAHPLHVEVVAGLVGRAELLMTAFFLAALLFAWSLIHAPGPRLRSVLKGIGLFLCSMLCIASKEHGAMLPLVACAMLLLPPPSAKKPVGWAALRARWRPGVLALACICAGFVPYFIARHHVLGAWLKPAARQILFEDNPLAILPADARFASALGLLLRAAGMFIFPVRLSPDYSPQSIQLSTSLSDPIVSAGMLFLLMAAAGVWWLRRRPAAWFGLVWIFATYLIASNLIVLIGTIFAERLLFLSSAGACLLIAALLAMCKFPARLTQLSPVLALGLLICMAYAVRTLVYEPYWGSEDTLLAYAAQRMPTNARMLLYYGDSLAKQGHWQEAETYEERALEISPGFFEAAFNLADVYKHTGRAADGFDLLKRMHTGNPSEPRVNDALARLYEAQGRPQDAYRVLSEGVEADPHGVRNALLLGQWLALHGERDAARPLLQGVLPELSPDDQRQARKLLGLPAQP